MADYYEIVLDGDVEVLKGFVAGYLAASGLGSSFFVAREANVEHDSLAHQLAEWVGLVADRTHLIVPDAACEQIREGVAELGDDLRLRFVEARRIDAARFRFSWRSFNREQAAGLRATFAQAPAGIRIEDHEEKEEVHEGETVHTAGYAPVHPYEASGSGVAAGDPGVLIAWASELRDAGAVDVDRIQLEFVD